MSGIAIPGAIFGGPGIEISIEGIISTAPAPAGTFVPLGLSAAATADALDAIGAAGDSAILGAGTYSIARPLVTSPRMRGVVGETILLWTGPAGAFAGGASGIAFATNAMVKNQGALNPARLNAVPTNVASGGVSYYPAGSQAISIDALDSIAAGDWITYFGGNDPAFQQYDASAGPDLVWSDLLQVDAIQAPLTLLLKQHTLSYHTLTKGASANPIQISIQAVTVVERVRYEGIIFDGAGIAVGVLCDWCVEPVFVDCEFRNFAAVGILLRWCTGFLSERSRMGGGLSGLILADASHRGTVRDTSSSDVGLRYPVIGHGYGAWCLRNDCAEWSVHDNDFSHFSIGANLAGFRDLQHDSNRYRDLDCVEYAIRDAADVGLYALGVIGIGMHQGVVNLGVAYFNPGLIDSGTMIVDARTNDGGGLPGDDCSYWMHDTYQVACTGLSILNKGKSPYQNINGLSRSMLGFRCQDWQGVVQNAAVVGCEYAWRLNSSFGGTFSCVRLAAAPAQGTAAVIGLMVETPWTETIFDDFNTFSMYFDAAIMPTLDYSECRVQNFTINSWFFRGVGVVAQNTTGAVRAGGDVVSYSNASAGFARLLVLQNDAAAQGLRKVMANQGGFGAPSGGWCFAESFPTYGRITCDATAVTLGATLNVVGGASVAVSPVGAGVKVASAEQIKGAVAGTILAGF